MRSLIRRWTRLTTVLADVQCGRCQRWYDPSDPADWWPHNNNAC
ncbi:hypothetical protein [Nocardiopsis sp. NPDC055824]